LTGKKKKRVGGRASCGVRVKDRETSLVRLPQARGGKKRKKKKGKCRRQRVSEGGGAFQILGPAVKKRGRRLRPWRQGGKGWEGKGENGCDCIAKKVHAIPKVTIPSQEKGVC